MAKIHVVTVSLSDADGQTIGVRKVLVRAHTKSGAINYAAGMTITATVATQDELVSAVTAGCKVHDATIARPQQLDLMEPPQ